jgi:hypothetical protein
MFVMNVSLSDAPGSRAGELTSSVEDLFMAIVFTCLVIHLSQPSYHAPGGIGYMSKIPRSGPRQLTPLFGGPSGAESLFMGSVHAKTTCREVFWPLLCKRLLTKLFKQEVHFLTKCPCHLP